MNNERPKRDSMSLEEATISNMWEIAAIVEVLERKGLCTKDESLGVLEEEARQSKRGLWADPNPVPPWEVRHPKGAQATVPQKDLLSSDPEEKSLPDTTMMQIIGNRNSHVYHRPDCPSYTATKPENRVVFNSEAEAETSGYRRAGNCP